METITLEDETGEQYQCLVTAEEYDKIIHGGRLHKIIFVFGSR